MSCSNRDTRGSEGLTEAIKRNPEDPKACSNHAAACLSPSCIYPEGLEDANKCLELDPRFVKGSHEKAQSSFSRGSITRPWKLTRPVRKMRPQVFCLAGAILAVFLYADVPDANAFPDANVCVEFA